jgi:ATP-dependent helicase/nuclease subunit A
LPSGKSLNAYTLVHKLCAATENWDDATNIFQIGEIPTQQKESVETIEYGLENYQSSPWRKKVSLQMRGSAELNDEIVIDAAQAGIVMHEQLSKIRYRQDLNRYIGLPLHEDLKAIVDHPELTHWFSEDWNVANEVPILLPGGDFKRIDRLNWREKETVVIDFKTGAKRKKDHYQVKDYMKILAQMGYQGIKGFLVYLQDLEVETVGK